MENLYFASWVHRKWSNSLCFNMWLGMDALYTYCFCTFVQASKLKIFSNLWITTSKFCLFLQLSAQEQIPQSYQWWCISGSAHWTDSAVSRWKWTRESFKNNTVLAYNFFTTISIRAAGTGIACLQKQYQQQNLYFRKLIY